MASYSAATETVDAPTRTRDAASWIARHRLILAGSLFVAAGNAVVYADAGYAIVSAVFALVLAISFLVPFLIALPFSRWRLAGALAFAVGAVHFVDVAFLDADLVSRIVVAVLPVVLVIAVVRGFEDLLLRFALTAIGFATLSILGQQLLAPAPLTPEAFAFAEEGSGTGQPYVHIVLDEMGPLSLMPGGAKFSALQKRMRADYAERGFILFDDTEVIAGATQTSLGHVLSNDGSIPVGLGEHDGFELDENRLLTELRTASYRLNVLQSSFLDLCTSDADACHNYSRSGDGAAIDAAAGSFRDRAEYALLDLHLGLINANSIRASRYYANIALALDTVGLDVPRSRLYVARPPQVLQLMRETAAALPALGRGEAFVGHFLLPHFPYVLGADCSLKDIEERSAPRWLSETDGASFARGETEAAYWEQAACTHDALMGMIDAVIDSPDGRQAIVVVHGDHGSRLLEKVADPHGADAGVDEEERRYSLFTHFAVRGLADRETELAAHPALRDRIGIVLQSLPETSPRAGAVR